MNRSMVPKYMATFLLMFLSINAHAGREGGNGGDICERRIKEIRDDISSWLSKGGANGLALPPQTTPASYVVAMQNAISDTEVSCVSETLRIGESEKTCINSVSNKGVRRIFCNIDRFQKTADSDQYVLVHHEYAGRAGLEINEGESSQYAISNQITGFLEDQIVKRLAIKPGSMSSASFLSCASPYAGSFTAKTENGWVSFSMEAFGYVRTLPLARKLGLSSQDPITKVEFLIPEGQCSWNKGLGTMSCSEHSVLMTFHGKSGSSLPFTAARIDVSVGVLGMGKSARQVIDLNIDTPDRGTIGDTQGYDARYAGDGARPGWYLCDRPLN